MKKGMICFVIAILLAFFTAGSVFAASSPFAAFSQFDSSSSPQLALALLQMELAKANKEQALSGIKEIEEQQAEKKKASDFLSTARECRAAAASTGGEAEMPSDMAEYMNSRGLAYAITGDDLLLTSKEWDAVITSLTGYLDNVGLGIQQKMLNLEDFMGQYNSYMAGANSAISQSNQVLSGLARGQSMYGDSEVGLAVTGLVVGLVLGCLITLAVQKSRGKKDKS